MTDLTIEQIIKLANRQDHPFRDNILNDLNGLILTRGVNDVDACSIADIYSTRYHINQTITKVETIHGWLPLINNLEKLAETKDSKVRLIPIETENAEYLHFVSPELDRILGVLQLTHIKLDRSKELNDEGQLKGTWGTECTFFDNHVEIKKCL